MARKASGGDKGRDLEQERADLELAMTLNSLAEWLGKEFDDSLFDAPTDGVQDGITPELISALDEAAEFLDLEAEEMARLGVGREVSMDDERLHAIAMNVVAWEALRSILDADRHRKTLKAGGAREKVGFTIDLLRRLILEDIAHLAEGSAEVGVWTGPDQRDMSAFAHAALAADELNGVLLGIGIMLEEERLGDREQAFKAFGIDYPV